MPIPHPANRTLEHAGPPAILLTIDVEEWFQVENFKPWIPDASWAERESRVEAATRGILDLLDAAAAGATVNRLRATFFVLGWVAERQPDLVREIARRGHEVASHGYGHQLASGQTRAELLRDIGASKRLLEDILGTGVVGYRAPSFSVRGELLEVLEELGFHYDSSYNSFGGNSRYGRLQMDRAPRRGAVVPVGEGLWELPISNWLVGGHALPWGGGGYFRLIPAPVHRLGVRAILKDQGAYVLYLHPWEFDPSQPRMRQAGWFYRFRHYVNLDRTAAKLAAFLDAFRHCRFPTCREWVAAAGRPAADRATAPAV